MFNKLYKVFLKFRIKYLPYFSKKDDINKVLAFEGFNIGKGTIFYSPTTLTIDRERPWMLKIGEYCKITKGTTILTHDYSRSVLRRVYGDIVGEAAETVIGDNVFIGVYSVILMGSHIGNNVIVGAGSVVSGIIPDNVVVAGNPAKIIRTLDEHYRLRKKRYVDEAKLFARNYLSFYGRKPKVSDMGPFFPIFLERSIDAIKESGINVNLNGDCKEEVIEEFLRTEPLYVNYDEFLNDSLNNEKYSNNSDYFRFY